MLDPPPAGLIVASPANPTGTMLHPDEFAALARWCSARHGVRMISDEIYHGLTWGTRCLHRGLRSRRYRHQQFFRNIFP